MPERFETVTATVLHRELAGEHHLRLYVFCGQTGLRRVLFRKSSRTNAAVAPDLFDAGSFVLDATRGVIYVKEFHLLHRMSGIAQHYDAFQAACTFADIFRRNTEHLHDPAEPARILRRALDAFGRGQRPDVVLFKSLYLLARSEGLPVKEHFIAELPSRQRVQAAEMLNQPLHEQIIPKDTVELLSQRLRAWLVGHAEFVI